MSQSTFDPRRRHFLMAGAAAATAAMLPVKRAYAQKDAWPAKPIKLVVGFAPGGITDGLPRLYAPVLSEKLGVPVVIENRSGAAGSIATTAVVQSPPDGYTLLASGVGQLVVLPHTSNMAINPMTDLVHISMLGRRRPDPQHQRGGPGQELRRVHCARQGEARRAVLRRCRRRRQPAPVPRVLQDARRRRPHRRPLPRRRSVDAGSPGQPRAAQPQCAFGRRSRTSRRASCGRSRSWPPSAIPSCPNVPTVAEVGLKPMEACSNWLGLHAPKGTPDAIVQKLHKAMVETMQSDTVKKGMETLNVYPVVSTPAEFSARIARDYALFGQGREGRERPGGVATMESERHSRVAERELRSFVQVLFEAAGLARGRCVHGHGQPRGVGPARHAFAWRDPHAVPRRSPAQGRSEPRVLSRPSCRRRRRRRCSMETARSVRSRQRVRWRSRSPRRASRASAWSARATAISSGPARITR